jgi:hypothetical protein
MLANVGFGLFPAFGGRGRLARRSKQVLRLFIPRDFLRFHHILKKLRMQIQV